MHVLTNEVTECFTGNTLWELHLDVLRGNDLEFSENIAFDGPSYLGQSTVGL